MHSRHCSTIGSRKSPRSVLLLLLAVPTIVAAQISPNVSATISHDFLSVSVDAAGADPEQLSANLRDGLTARVEFSIRVVERRNTRVTLFGPRVIREFSIAYDASWDPFRKRYAIRSNDGALYTFRDVASFQEFFFRLSDYRIPMSALVSDGDEAQDRYSVEARSTYHPIVFVSGLSVLSLVIGPSTQRSGWVRVDPEVRE